MVTFVFPLSIYEFNQNRRLTKHIASLNNRVRINYTKYPEYKYFYTNPANPKQNRNHQD